MGRIKSQYMENISTVATHAEIYYITWRNAFTAIVNGTVECKRVRRDRETNKIIASWEKFPLIIEQIYYFDTAYAAAKLVRKEYGKKLPVYIIRTENDLIKKGE